MTGLRRERLREDIKRVVSEVIRQMKDPRLGFVTVTDVVLSSDLRYVKVFVSVLGGPDEKRISFETLMGAVGFVRSQIGRQVRLRYTPELSFKLDPSIERATRINKLLEEVKPERTEPLGSRGEDHR
ncbi:MAG: 30S ribosome-binding factor RbfA [Firmicutes bacterium]|nr:30S ribosome-binding factor RbfA [Bacillota bacterium]